MQRLFRLNNHDLEWHKHDLSDVVRISLVSCQRKRTSHEDGTIGCDQDSNWPQEGDKKPHLWPWTAQFLKGFLHVSLKSLTGSELGLKAVNYLLSSLHSSVSTNYSQWPLGPFMRPCEDLQLIPGVEALQCWALTSLMLTVHTSWLVQYIFFFFCFLYETNRVLALFKDDSWHYLPRQEETTDLSVECVWPRVMMKK